MAFLATYDTPAAGAYERHLVRIARTWMNIQKADYSVQGIVNRLMEDFSRPKPDDYGCGWDDLKQLFTEWAIAEQWVKPPSAAATPAPAPTRRRVAKKRENNRKAP